MPRTLLISDANILIDIEVGGLVDPMFRLEYEFGVPDILYEQELKVHHGRLVERGLRSLALGPDAMSRVVALRGKHQRVGVSINDLFALALAEQEKTTLLTGDSKLRQVCLAENMAVHGTVWLVGEMLRTGHIDRGQARKAYEAMKRDRSRLPWNEIEKQLNLSE